MSSDIESRLRTIVDKGKPVLEALIADLEREATIIRERDLDPRKLAEEPRVQDARTAVVDALEHLAAFAKSLDGVLKTYADEAEDKIDLSSLKDRVASVPAAGKSLLTHDEGQDLASRVRDETAHAGVRVAERAERGKENLVESVHQGREHAEAAIGKGKDELHSAATRGKETTREMLAALGWLAAAGGVIYVVFMDERRRAQARRLAKAGIDLLTVAASSTSKRP